MCRESFADGMGLAPGQTAVCGLGLPGNGRRTVLIANLNKDRTVCRFRCVQFVTFCRVVSRRGRDRGKDLPCHSVIIRYRCRHPRRHSCLGGSCGIQVFARHEETPAFQPYRTVRIVDRRTVFFAPADPAVRGPAHPEAVFFFQQIQCDAPFDHVPCRIVFPSCVQCTQAGEIVDQNGAVRRNAETRIPVIKGALTQKFRSGPVPAAIR